MAGVVGKAGSFATVDKVDDTIGQAFKDVNTMFEDSAKAKKADEEAKRKQEDANLKELEDYNGKFGVDITGNQSVDDLTVSYTSQARDMTADLVRRRQTSTNPQERADLTKKINKIYGGYDVLKQMPVVLNNRVEEITKGVTDGKYNDRDVDAVQKTLSNVLSGNARLYVDDYGQTRVTVYDVTEEEKAKGILEKDITLAELIKSTQPFLASTYDTPNGISDQFLKQVKLDKEKIQSGFTTITNEQMSKRVEDMIAQKAKEVSTDDNEVYEIWNKMGKPSKRKFDDADRKEVEEYVKKDLLGRYNKSYEKDIDQSAITSRMNALKEDKEEKPSYNVVQTPQEYAAAGFKPAKGYKTVSITTKKQKPVNNITMVNQESGKEIIYNNVFLNNYTVVKNSKGQRSIVAQITYPDVKTSTLTAEESITWKKNLKDPNSLTDEEELIVSRITKGVEYKTVTIPMKEVDIVKFKDVVGASDANGMKDLARVGEEEKFDEYGVPIN